MSVIACILFNMVVFLNGSYCLQYYVGIQENDLRKVYNLDVCIMQISVYIRSNGRL